MSMYNKKKLLFILLFGNTIYAEKPLEIGNLTVPISQQIAPLISFGQHIVDAEQLQLFFNAGYLKGKHKKTTSVNPHICYGIVDRLSLLIEIPAAFSRNNCYCSKGMEDMIVQFEYVFSDKESLMHVHKNTFVINMTLPTGSAYKNPATGFGAPSIFLGITDRHVSPDWYFLLSPAMIITMPYNNTKFGTQFLYQGGIGKNIAYKMHEWVLSWIIEIDGTYQRRNIVHGAIDCNSGGNTILLTPSIWYSAQHLIFQAGIAFTVGQSLNGKQNRDIAQFIVNIGWTF